MGVRMYQRNHVQSGDSLALLQSLPDSCTPLVFFDPQHRAVLDKLKFGNECARQRGRAGLPTMSEDYIGIHPHIKPIGLIKRLSPRDDFSLDCCRIATCMPE